MRMIYEAKRPSGNSFASSSSFNSRKRFGASGPWMGILRSLALVEDMIYQLLGEMRAAVRFLREQHQQPLMSAPKNSISVRSERTQVSSLH
jgi:hypothetical protein